MPDPSNIPSLDQPHEKSIAIGTSRWSTQSRPQTTQLASAEHVLDEDSSGDELLDEVASRSSDEEDEEGSEDSDMEDLLLEFFPKAAGGVDGVGIRASLGERFEQAAYDALSGMPNSCCVIRQH